MNHERGGGVVPYEAHNLEAPVQFGPPQHITDASHRKFETRISKFETIPKFK